MCDKLRTMTKDDTLRMTMLLDFYGELLTEKQREYFELYHNENYSLSEIAENEGITKQGVHEIITRVEKKLLEIEKKTGLMHKWSETRKTLIQAVKKGTQMHPAVLTYFRMENEIGI